MLGKCEVLGLIPSTKTNIKTKELWRQLEPRGESLVKIENCRQTCIKRKPRQPLTTQKYRDH